MSGRATSNPPVIPGYTPIELIGTGGYADVFLYEQQMPLRRVAVKVLVGDALTGDAQRRQFTAEANLMARVSTHPYIVSIFHADVAQDGRPYLVMEYYPGENYLRRARTEQFSVAEVLRVGVQIGSAVETAHRAGILHRDIKPANILTSEFRRPGLADFGIASSQTPGAEETQGVSIPWSPPEAFGSGELGAAADVYSLAATLYHLLAARSPFEIPGGDNSPLAFMSRIERLPVPALGRADVPPSLDRILVQAMSKSSSHRPATVVEFIRQLQGVEAELKLAVTPLELADDGSTARARRTVDDEDATRVRGITEIQAQPPATINSIPSSPTVPSTPIPERRRQGLLAEPEVADTMHRLPTAAPAAPAPERSSRTRLWVLLGSGFSVVAAVIGFVVVGSGGGSSEPDTTDDGTEVNDGFGTTAPVVVAPQVAGVTGLANADGTFTFSWEPVGGPGTEYIVNDEGGSPRPPSADTTYTGGAQCVRVATVDPSGNISAPVRGCAP